MPAGDRRGAGDARPRLADARDHLLLADDHCDRRCSHRRLTSSFVPGRITAAAAARPRSISAKVVGIDLRGIGDAALIERHAIEPVDLPELVLDRVVGRQHDQPDAGTVGDAAVELERHVGLADHARGRVRLSDNPVHAASASDRRRPAPASPIIGEPRGRRSFAPGRPAGAPRPDTAPCDVSRETY